MFNLKKLANYWRKLTRSKPKFLIDNPGKIVEAFVHDGISYFQFADHFSLPTIRGLQALDYFEEFNMRCTKEYLTQFVAAMEDIMSPAQGKKLDLIRMGQLIRYLKERLDLIPVPDQVYRLASVVYFDQNEDPFFYDRKAADAKIERWKKDPEMLSFFLRQQFGDLIPLSTLPNLSSATYSEVVERINEIHMRALSSPSSGKTTKIDIRS